MKTRAPHHPAIEPLESRIAPAVIFTVETSTNKLVSFDSATPGTLNADVTITGLQANEFIAAIDFRPATGELYGLGLVDDGATRTGRLYIIDPVTAVATHVGAGAFSTGDTERFGFDFNPTVDRIRVTNLLDANFRLNPDDGTIFGVDTNISDGTATDENLTGVAYDRNFGSNLTTLYGYDYFNDNLVTVGGLNSNPSPNSGLLTTVARAKLGGVNFSSSSSVLGFDIGGDFGGSDVGWLGVDKIGQAGAHLYTIDLATAAMTDLGQIGGSARLFGGLAVQLNAPAPVISTDGKTATWRDLDGDNVTLKITKGTLTPASFRMLQGANETSALSKLTITDPTFTGTNLTITAKPGPDGGDGRVNIGQINATGVDLGIVTIAGDLIAIDAGSAAAPAPSIKSLTVASMGAFGRGPLSGAEDTRSSLADGAGKIAIAGDLCTYLSLGTRKTGVFTVGGDLFGGTEAGSGWIVNENTATLTKLAIKGSIRSTDTFAGGQISAFGVGAFSVGGSIFGSAANDSAKLQIAGIGKTVVTIVGDFVGGGGSSSAMATFVNAGTIKIGGSVKGSSGANSAALFFTTESAITIKGSVISGAGTFSGIIAGASIKSLTVGGSIVADGSDQFINTDKLGAVKIGGDVLGLNGHSVTIIAKGKASPVNAADALAIGSFIVAGDVKNAVITAGLDFTLGGFTPDAAIGVVKIGGSMIASSITAGIDPVNGKFGDTDDKFVGGNVGNAAIIAKIASVTIGGQLLGTAGGAPDTFGILAEQIGKLTIGKVKVPLTTGKDDLTLGFTSDVRVREL